MIQNEDGGLSDRGMDNRNKNLEQHALWPYIIYVTLELILQNILKARKKGIMFFR